MHKLLPLALLLALLSLSAAVAPGSSAEVVPQDEAEQEKSVLEQSMGTLMKGQRVLRKLVKDPKGSKDALLSTLGEMEAAILVAYGEKPHEPEGKSAEELALFRVGFKSNMTRLLQSVLAMHEATLNGDAEALGAAYEELGSTKKRGHDSYKDQ